MATYKTYTAFWDEFLDHHNHLETRVVHFVGTSIALFALVTAVFTWQLGYVWVTPIAAYGASWIGHIVFEHNRPTSLSHPIWALKANLQLYWMMMTQGMMIDSQRPTT